MTKKPATGTAEWASSNVNVISGCSNDCAYCYAKAQALRFGRKTPATWATEEVNEKALEKGYARRKGTVMFPTTHDITQRNIHTCAPVLAKLLRAGNNVLVVSKPDPVAIQALCKYVTDYRQYPTALKAQVLFRFTIGSSQTQTLKLWEPGAPSYEERLYALMWAHRNGWQTSVSMEPLLERHWDRVVEQVLAMEPYVTDAIWIGRLNHPTARVIGNYPKGEVPLEVASELHRLVESQRDSRINDLYTLLKTRPKVRWKESIKRVVGLEVATEKGTDR